MENDNQTNCTCSLVRLSYQTTKKPTPTHLLNNSTKYLQTNSKKSKVSLSRSTSGLVLNQVSLNGSDGSLKDSQDHRNGYQRCNIYQENTGHEARKSIHSKTYEPKLRKKYIKGQIRTENGPEKYNSDLEKTQNTAFDNSMEYLQRKNADNRRPSDLVSFSFFNDNNTNSKMGSGKCMSKEYRDKPNGGRENTYCHKPTNFSSLYEAGRKIKTLKQLEYRNAESSGGGTSENHVSMIMSVSEAKSQELKGLNELARKSSSFTRIPKTFHEVA